MIFQENIICQKRNFDRPLMRWWILNPECYHVDRPAMPKVVTSRPKLVISGISQNCMDFRYAHHIYFLWRPNVEKRVESAMQFDKTQGTDMHLKRYRKVHEMFKSYRCIIITLSILKYHSVSLQEGKVNINDRMEI